MTLPKRSILYFGCTSAERADAEKRLTSAGVHPTWIESSNQAAFELSRRQVPVVIDLFRGGAALQVARDIRTQRPGATLFAIADYARPDLTTEALLIGVADVLARPADGGRIARAIDREAARLSRAANAAAADAGAAPDDLYSSSSAMREILPLIARAAVEGGAIVAGEDGSGRHAVAAAIHQSADPEGRGRFVAVDCAAPSAKDLGLDLFGCDDDTTASKTPERVSERSRLYEACGGTLYLRNVTETSGRVQARLARLLRDGEAAVIETGTTLPLNVRLVLGGDQGLDLAAEDGRLREDLVRRVSGVRISVPPLRGRVEDIAPLANHFVREACAARRVPARLMARSVVSLFAALPWRGNVSELRKVVEAVVTTGSGSRIALEDVLMHVRLDGGATVFSGSGTLRQARARFERDYIAAMLRQHRGRMSEAAKALGIQRPNLYRKIRALNVTRVGVRREVA